MNLAPATNYQDEVTLSRTAMEASTNSGITKRFYVRTRTGRFAAMAFEIGYLYRLKETTLNATISYNPSGSRNLEFDQRKWINR